MEALRRRLGQTGGGGAGERRKPAAKSPARGGAKADAPAKPPARRSPAKKRA